MVLPVKNRTDDHQHLILHILIRLSIKFQLKLIICISNGMASSAINDKFDKW